MLVTMVTMVIKENHDQLPQDIILMSECMVLISEYIIVIEQAPGTVTTASY